MSGRSLLAPVLVASLALAHGAHPVADVHQAPPAAIHVGSGPEAILFDGRSLWVANQFGNTVSRIDPASGEVLATVRVGNRPIALAFDGTLVWTANLLDNTVTGVRATDGEIMRVVTVPAGPGGLAVEGGSLWVACRDAGAVARV
jgi:YVTN family beta-propeller protein